MIIKGWIATIGENSKTINILKWKKKTIIMSCIIKLNVWLYTGTRVEIDEFTCVFLIDRNVVNSNTMSCKFHRFSPMSLSQNVRVLDRHASKHAQKC